MALMITIIVLCVVIGVPGTLLWWRLADNWADAEHKRFPTRPERAAPRGPEPTVVDFDADSTR